MECFSFIIYVYGFKFVKLIEMIVFNEVCFNWIDKMWLFGNYSFIKVSKFFYFFKDFMLGLDVYVEIELIGLW